MFDDFSFKTKHLFSYNGYVIMKQIKNEYIFCFYSDLCIQKEKGEEAYELRQNQQKATGDFRIYEE